MMGMRASSRRAFEIGHYLLLARVIQRGQRFIHQKQLRGGKQGAANGDALLFTAESRFG